MVAARTATIPGELSFSEGELLIVTAPPPGLDGWLDAKTMDGRAGRVPTSWSKRYTGACVCSATMVHYGSQVDALFLEAPPPPPPPPPPRPPPPLLSHPAELPPGVDPHGMGSVTGANTMNLTGLEDTGSTPPPTEL
jgi:hypothetical protein